MELSSTRRPVMQTGAVGGITNIHTGTFTYGFETFQNLNRGRAILADAAALAGSGAAGVVLGILGHGYLT